jgi:hypothetical protein
MKLTLGHFIEAYVASFRNRDIVFGKINIKEVGMRFLFRSMGYAAIMIAKVLLARFFKVNPTADTIFFSWGPLHSKLAHRIGQQDTLVYYDYKSLQGDQVARFKNISLITSIRHARSVMHSTARSKNSYDNFFYCLGFVIEFQMVNNLLKDVRHVFMAGQLDRYAIMLSIICTHENKYASFVQHGLNHLYEGLYKLHADEIYYLFEISIPFFGTYVRDAQNKKYIPIPKVIPDFKEDLKYENAIGFASQCLVGDLVILDILTQYYEGDILIYPHPTETNVDYYSKYKQKPNVHITRQKIRNIKYLFSSGSTLGVEYHLLGVMPVFINLNNFESEIFETSEFINFKDIDSFKSWFLANVATVKTMVS